MSNADVREGTSIGQPQNGKKRSINPPRIQPGCVYSRRDLVNNFGMDGDELTRLKNLKEHGLYPLDMGTREEFYLADEFIQFYVNRPRKSPTVKPAPTPPTKKRK